MVMRSPCAGDALEPPVMECSLHTLSISLFLASKKIKGINPSPHPWLNQSPLQASAPRCTTQRFDVACTLIGSPPRLGCSCGDPRRRAVGLRLPLHRAACGPCIWPWGTTFASRQKWGFPKKTYHALPGPRPECSAFLLIMVRVYSVRDSYVY
jgi:hypothetical protein